MKGPVGKKVGVSGKTARGPSTPREVRRRLVVQGKQRGLKPQSSRWRGQQRQTLAVTKATASEAYDFQTTRASGKEMSVCELWALGLLPSPAPRPSVATTASSASVFTHACRPCLLPPPTPAPPLALRRPAHCTCPLICAYRSHNERSVKAKGKAKRYGRVAEK